MKLLIGLLAINLFIFRAEAQITPLPVDQYTVALWNFNNDPSPSVVSDSGPNQIHGTSVNTGFFQQSPIYLQSRVFTTPSSHLSFGLLTPSHPLDLRDDEEWTIEFAYFPLASVAGRRIIFENGKVSVELRDNKIAVMLLRNGIWQGITTTRTLSPLSFWRIAVIFDEEESELGIKVNNVTWAVLKLDPAKKNRKKINDYNSPILIGSSPREHTDLVAMGRKHGCLSTQAGDIMCWGSNESGQLGDGMVETESNIALVVEGLKNATALSAGFGHSCAASVGKTFCWGSNSSNALGVSGILFSALPIEVPGVLNVTAIESGDYHSCAIQSDKTLKCWGLNQTGQLGLGFLSDSALPTQVPGLTNVKQISLGKLHSCAVDTSGIAYCWGMNSRGQAGQIATNAILQVPQQVPGLSGVLKIEAGNLHTCAHLSTNEIKCWGANDFGQLGIGNLTSTHIPTMALNLANDNIIDVGAGLGEHTCAHVKPVSNPAANNLKCWGRNHLQQVGQVNTQQNFSSPILVTSAQPALGNLQVGGNTNCYRGNTAGFFCLGGNVSGSLGSGTSAPSATFPEILWAAKQTQVNGFLDDIRISNVTRFSFSRPEMTLTSPLGTVDISNPQITLSINSSFALSSSTLQVYLNKSLVTGLSLNGMTLTGVLSAPLLRGENQLEVYISDVDGNLGEFRGKLSYSPLLNPEKPHKIATKGGTSCYLTGLGEVWCWGSNAFGQLGVEPLRFSSSPVKNPHLKNIVDLFTAETSLCALNDKSEVLCWGNNAFGQLGNEDYYRSSRIFPDQVVLTKPLLKIISGSDLYCAVHTDGTMSCWGNQQFGMLGTSNFQHRPTAYTEITGVRDGALGPMHACFIKTDNTLWCAGNNYAGQLGRGTITPEESIGQVPGLTDVKSVYIAYESTCAVTYSNQAYCWGKNRSFQAGIGQSAPGYITSPTLITTVTDSVKTSQTDNSGCSLNTQASLTCWGRNFKGEVGDGTFDQNPVGFEHAFEFLDFVTGSGTVCGLTTDQKVFCWGSNILGQTGTQNLTYINIPTEVLPHQGATRTLSSISAGFSNSCMKINEEIHCWGNNEQEQLGIPNLTFVELHPVKLTGLENMVKTSVGYGLICHVTPTAQAICSGFNNFGQAGASTQANPVNVNPPVTLPLSDVTSVEAGLDAACALKSDGTVWCWGNNHRGQLGDGTYTASHIPKKVQGLTNVTQISLAERGNHACAIKNDGTLWCWGWNENKQVEPGPNETLNTPVKVEGLPAITQISLGARFTCAVTAAKMVVCYGANSYGQSGTGNLESNLELKEVTNVSEALVVSAGEDFACSLDESRTVKCWGRNHYGQLGNGILENSLTPVTVMKEVDEITSGSYHSCVLSNNKLACWGNNAGNFGNGTMANSSVPVFSDVNKKKR